MPLISTFAAASVRGLRGFGGADGIARIPTMTAATVDGVTMTATSVFGSGNEAWRAGDKLPTSGGLQCWLSANSVNANLNIDLGVARIIRSYDAQNDGSYQSGLTVSWNFQGANASDYSDAVTLDSHGPVTWGNPSTITRTIATPGSYRYYRFVTTQRGGGYSGFSEVQLYT
jgi:hypothetical protein